MQHVIQQELHLSSVQIDFARETKRNPHKPTVGNGTNDQVWGGGRGYEG